MNQQSIRIAAAVLYDMIPNMQIRWVESPLYDLLCIMNSKDLVFAAKVVDMDHKGKIIDEAQLQRIWALGKDEQVPIIALFVDKELFLVKTAILVGWKLDYPVINKDICPIEMTPANWPTIFEQILCSDKAIRCLEYSGLRVKKTINIHTMNGDGCIVYFRNFTDTYKMKPMMNSNNESQFKKYLYGYDEACYPHDYLDEIIMNVIPDEIEKECVSSIMMFNTDLQSHQLLNKQKRFSITLRIEPDIDALYSSGQLSFLSIIIPLELFTCSFKISPIAIDPCVPISLDKWPELSQTIIKAKGTYQVASKFFFNP